MPNRTTTRRLPPLSPIAIAACSIALMSGHEMQLLPAGEFRAYDGRPFDAPRWYVDEALARALIAAADTRLNPYVVDYEHQTLLAKQNGQPAPAAGFFSKLEWREGTGLFALDVEWTPRAKEMIDAGEYRYISPVIGYDKATGNVTALHMAAITNTAAIHGMEEVLLAAATQHFSLPPQTASLTEENSMNIEELLEQLRWLLNLPVGSTADDILAHLKKLSDTIKAEVGTAAASFDLVACLQKQRESIASLSAATPDPAKFVGIEVMQNLQSQVVQLTQDLNASRLDGVIKTALESGKLLPAQEAWAREFGKKDYAALSAYLDSAPPLSILGGMQTGGRQPTGAPQPGSLTDNQAALCQAFGVSAEAFAQTLNVETQK